MNSEQRRQEAIEAQQACAHDPQPVAGMSYVRRCSKCGKFFGKNEADMIDMKRKAEVESDRPQ